MTNHGISNNKSGEQPNAKRGETAANQIDTGSSETGHANHFLQDNEGILFGKMMESETTKDQFGTSKAERKLASVGLDKKHFLPGRRSGTGDLKGLKLDIDGDDGDLALVGASKLDQIPAMITVTTGQIDQDKAVNAFGKFVEDFFDGILASERFVKSRDVFEITAQGGFILIG